MAYTGIDTNKVLAMVSLDLCDSLSRSQLATLSSIPRIISSQNCSKFRRGLRGGIATITSAMCATIPTMIAMKFRKVASTTAMIVGLK